MLRYAGIFAVTLSLSACGGNGAKIISFQPQVWDGDENRVRVTRQGMNVTSTDTERLAQAHCEKYGKSAKLTKLANPLILPVADEYACE